jgi:hypothetical protein
MPWYKEIPKPIMPFSIPLTCWMKKRRDRKKKGIAIPMTGELLVD